MKRDQARNLAASQRQSQNRVTPTLQTTNGPSPLKFDVEQSENLEHSENNIPESGGHTQRPLVYVDPEDGFEQGISLGLERDGLGPITEESQNQSGVQRKRWDTSSSGKAQTEIRKTQTANNYYKSRNQVTMF